MTTATFTRTDVIRQILGYCQSLSGVNRYCHVVHTPPESTIGGFSCFLISIDGDEAVVEIANGDRYTVPLAEISIRGTDI